MPLDEVIEDEAELLIRGGEDDQEETPDDQTQAEEEERTEDPSPSNDAGSDAGETTANQHPKKPEGDWIPKARFDDVWGRMRRAESERDDYRAEIATLKRSNTELKDALAKQGDASKGEELKEPRLEDFDYDDQKYQDAKVEYRVNKRLSDEKRQQEQKERQEQEQRKQQEQLELNKSFMLGVQDQAAKDESYAQAIKQYGDLPYNQDLLGRVMKSKEAAKIDAYFYSDLSEFERVNSLERDDAIEALAMIKQRLSTTQSAGKGATQQQRKQSSAPPPIRQPVGATGTVVNDPDVEEYTIR